MQDIGLLVEVLWNFYELESQPFIKISSALIPILNISKWKPLQEKGIDLL